MTGLDEVIAEMICFEAGRPDWSRQLEIFAPGARLVRIIDEGVFELDLQSYRENLDRAIDSGAMDARVARRSRPQSRREQHSTVSA